MLETVKNTIRRYKMLDAGEQVVVALSGGADSVSLVLALKRLGYNVRAVHVNHQLRGEESERDERFCTSFCEKIGAKLDVFRVDVTDYCKKSGLSVETAARELRYGAFSQIEPSLRIATAHTADDCLETTLFNLSRGTGIKGLRGIPAVRGRFVRPLADTTRKQIEEFLEKENQDYVTDSTNFKTDCSRNKIRHLVVPQLKAVNPELLKNYISTRENIEQDMDFLEKEAQKAFEKIKTCDEKTYDISRIEEAHIAIKRRVFGRILKENNVEVLKEKILELEKICLNGGKINVKAGLFFECKNGCLKAVCEYEPHKDFAVTVKNPGEIVFFDRKVRLSVAESNNVNKIFTNSIADYDKIKGLIVVRNRRDGDKIRLCRRDFTSSVKKLFNQAFDRQLRDSRVIVADDEGLIFVEGFGVARRVCADENTKRLLEIKIID